MCRGEAALPVVMCRPMRPSHKVFHGMVCMQTKATSENMGDSLLKGLLIGGLHVRVELRC